VADGAQPHKRHRGEKEEPKDWRDVHLSSSKKESVPPSSHGRGRAESLERIKRGSGSRRERDGHRRSDYRERERDGDRGRERERERDRGKRDDRERHHKEEKTNGQTVQAEEREEGE